MKFKQKSLMVGALFLSLGLLAGCAPHWFCDKLFPAKDTQERSAFHRRWARYRFADGNFFDHVMKHLGKRVEELDLSESQSTGVC